MVGGGGGADWLCNRGLVLHELRELAHRALILSFSRSAVHTLDAIKNKPV